jgi:sigma-B regulation protein RsbU (phosphoserine phosphatase)
MKTAQKRQLRMLPSVPEVQGFEFEALYQPCAKVSGDFYDFIRAGEGQIGIALGDVSGHGIEAAIIMGMAKKALQIYARGLASPCEALALTNQDLAGDLDDGTFISAAYGILDTTARVFKFSRAGHNPALLANPLRDPPIRELKPGGMVIGVDKSGRRFRMLAEEQAVQLEPGDLIFQYTDGLTEAANAKKEEFGMERVKEAVLGGAERALSTLLAQLAQSVKEHIGSQEQDDDITMIAFRMPA